MIRYFDHELDSNIKSISGHDAQAEIPTADQLKLRFEQVFYALPRRMQDAFVRLMELGVQSLRG